MAKDETVSQTDVLLQIAQTLAAVQAQAMGGADITAALKQITETLAGVANRSRPENPDHNGISAFSYPEGDYAHPKEKLKCEMYWVGFPETAETLTPTEIACLNALMPGEYFVTKGNGDRIPFNVSGKKKQNGDLESLWIDFPCKGDQRHDHRSKVDYCREAMGEKVKSYDDLMKELETLRAVVAAA